jgi:ketosteroid isomerase-like protein
MSAMNAMNATNQATIERFYAAFAQLDGDTMQACYANDARFEDEVFALTGQRQIGGMWRMLCTATRDKGRAHWKIETRDVTDHSAHWDAHYLFSATGRKVLNRIDAEFEFNSAGLIVKHRDRFDFWAWSRQALGVPGLVLGWAPFFRKQVKAQAAANLERFLAKA